MFVVAIEQYQLSLLLPLLLPLLLSLSTLVLLVQLPGIFDNISWIDITWIDTEFVSFNYQFAKGMFLMTTDV